MTGSNDVARESEQADQHTQEPTCDILELARRWQVAWTSKRNGARNAVGDSFGQLADEIERLRAVASAAREMVRALEALSRPDGFARVSLGEEKEARMAFAERATRAAHAAGIKGE